MHIIRKRQLLLLTAILILHGRSYSQSLSIDETIGYLNKLSIQNPDISHDPNKGDASLANLQWPCETIKNYYTFSIGKDGLITVETFSSWYNCKDKNEENRKGSFVYAKFFIEDIDMDNIDTYNKYGSSEKGFILKTVNNYNSISSPLKDAEDYKTSEVSFTTSDHYNKMRFYNAMKYLISSALEHGYKRADKDDPFVERSTNVNAPSHNSGKLEYKIPLKEINGVFSLKVNVSGIILNFILDSGAGESNLSSDAEGELISKGIIKQKDYLSKGLYKLADGSISECKRVKISKITVGGKTIYNVITSIGPVGSLNLLGQSFLSKTNMWTIDNEKKCLLIH